MFVKLDEFYRYADPVPPAIKAVGISLGGNQYNFAVVAPLMSAPRLFIALVVVLLRGDVPKTLPRSL